MLSQVISMHLWIEWFGIYGMRKAQFFLAHEKMRFEMYGALTIQWWCLKKVKRSIYTWCVSASCVGMAAFTVNPDYWYMVNCKSGAKWGCIISQIKLNVGCRDDTLTRMPTLSQFLSSQMGCLVGSTGETHCVLLSCRTWWFIWSQVPHLAGSSSGSGHQLCWQHRYPLN